MYIPPKFKLEDQNKILDYIREYPFATLITANNNSPVATHVPFILEQKNDKWYLLGHMAKANPQWQLLENNRALIIFQEPHAYISPSYYEKEENVPTWNYIAVHVYGKTQLLLEDSDAINILEKTIGVFDKNYQTQWESLRKEYKYRLLKGMVAFQIEIEEWQGKEKLSQNKSISEQQKISEGLSQSKDSSAQQLGLIMKKNYEL